MANVSPSATPNVPTTTLASRSVTRHCAFKNHFASLQLAAATGALVAAMVTQCLICRMWMAHPVQSSRAFAHATASAIRFVSEADMCSAQAHVCFGSKADMCSARAHVRFTPNSDRKSGLPQTVVSALPPKADMCDATRDVRFGPIADSCTAANSIAIRSPRRRPPTGFAGA
jgi:hypothetical protein